MPDTANPVFEFASSNKSTGVPGLDSVLGGGWPTGHVYVVSGQPGCGKTTLGLQFLLEGISNGERVLYITLAESGRELRQVANSHGWSLRGIEIFELLPMEESLKVEEQYTVLYPGEVEMSGIIKSILARIEEVEPKRVVFDSLSELWLLARESLRFRRQLLALKQYFAGRETTVLMLDDHTATEVERDLQSIVHGVLRLENLARDYGTRRRRLEVLKLRGVVFREGFHDYDIRTGGLVVYPRLVATQHHTEFHPEMVTSGIPHLDDLLGGGLNRGTSTLLVGPAGAGKSSISLQYAACSAQSGERAMYITFDEGYGTLAERALSLGTDIRKLQAHGLLKLSFVDPADLSPGRFVETIRQEVDAHGTRVVVIDSLNGFLAAMPSEAYLDIQLRELLSYLNNCGVVTILVLAQYGILGQGMVSPVDVSYLSDTILLLRYFEYRGEVRQAISVVKKRSGRHERSIRELILETGGIRVGEPLRDFHGVLTGVPVFTGTGALRDGIYDETQQHQHLRNTSNG